MCDRRVLGCLERAGVKLAGDLARKTRRELLEVSGLGRKVLQEIEAVLEDVGLRLADDA